MSPLELKTRDEISWRHQDVPQALGPDEPHLGDDNMQQHLKSVPSHLLHLLPHIFHPWSNKQKVTKKEMKHRRSFTKEKGENE